MFDIKCFIQTLRSVLNTSKLVTAFESNHLTSFATGFRPQTNTIDFQFVFAFPSFEDNMTIFVRRRFCSFSVFSSVITTDYFQILVILTIIVYIILMIYATIGDVKDKNKVTFETILFFVVTPIFTTRAAALSSDAFVQLLVLFFQSSSFSWLFYLCHHDIVTDSVWMSYFLTFY